MSTYDRDPAGRGRATPPPPQYAVPKPLYSQVRDLIADQISSGQWGPGAALPNENTLAQRFGVSIGTIRRAVEGLEEMGIVLRRQGRGTFVSGGGVPTLPERLRNVRGESTDIRRRLLRVHRRKIDAHEASRLSVDANANVLEISMTALIADVQIGFERSIVSADLTRHCEVSFERGRDIYGALAEEGIFVVRAEDLISATAAQFDDETDLGVAKGQPLLKIVRRAFAVNDRPVELRTARYLATAVTYLHAME